MIKITQNFNSNRVNFTANNDKSAAPKALPKSFSAFDKKAPSAPILTSALLAQLPNVKMPSNVRNYCVFDEKKVNSFVARGESSVPELENVLKTSKDEKQIVETLYILDRMIDSGVKGVDKLYPALSAFNNTDSPNIQVFLAGIYRKTQVPDAFGPLIKMLIKDSQKPALKPEEAQTKTAPTCPNCESFDPTEEVGGAILEYIRNYSNMPQKPEQK